MQHDFILLDRSNSMRSLWDEAINSINVYTAKLATDLVDTGVTIAAFDAHSGSLDFHVLRDRITPSTLKPLSPEEVYPRGMTPLFDAVGKIVSLAEAGNYEKCAIIIMTDGEENSSREIRLDAAKAMLDRCRAKGWQVIFLGANFDNATQAASLGNSARNTIAASAKNLSGTMANMGTLRSAYASSGKAMAFTEEEKIRARD